MNSLKLLSHPELHAQTKKAAANEKAATLVLLEHLAEIESRRLYALYAKPSLWEYVKTELGYSDSQTFDRINAMRLMVKIPEIKTELKEGTLTLTATAKLGSFVRKEKLNQDDARVLMKEVSGKSVSEIEKVLLAKIEEHSPTPKTKLTQITLEVSDEFMGLIQRIKEIKGNPALKNEDVIKIALEDFVRRRDQKPAQKCTPRLIQKSVPTSVQRSVQTSVQENAQKPSSRLERTNAAPHGSTQVISSRALPAQASLPTQTALSGQTNSPLSTTPIELLSLAKTDTKKPSRYIPVKVKWAVRERSEDRCEFVSPITRERCNSRWILQFEHSIPYAKGGPQTEQNLKYFCAEHNRLAAIQQFGLEKMNPFLKR